MDIQKSSGPAMEPCSFQMVAATILEGRQQEQYAQRRRWLRRAYSTYIERSPADPVRIILERAAKTYQTICEQQGEGGRRRYRIFSQRFLSSLSGSNRAAADKEYISERTAYKDIDHALDDLMVLVFGVDGVVFHSGEAPT